jgi:hypothetical protein
MARKAPGCLQGPPERGHPHLGGRQVQRGEVGGQEGGVLLPPLGQQGVAANLAMQSVLTLPVPGKSWITPK